MVMASEQYTPDPDELQDAVVFLSQCSSKDLKESWTKISCDWDIDSVTHVHRMLCKSGRINILLEQFTQT